MPTDREKLVQIHERFETERRRILADPAMLADGERVPPRLIRKLADIDGAARAVAAEIARHTPKVGSGGET